MKAILENPMFNDENFNHLNWFMTIVAMSENPVDLIRNLYEEGMLPNGLDGTDCYVDVKKYSVLLFEKINDDKERLICYVPYTKIKE